MLTKVQIIRTSLLEVEESEPLFRKIQQDVEKEFNEEAINHLFGMIQNEINIFAEIRSEEVQKVRAKERSNKNWGKLKEKVTYKNSKLLKLNLGDLAKNMT